MGRQIEAFPRPMGTRPLEDFIQDIFNWALTNEYTFIYSFGICHNHGNSILQSPYGISSQSTFIANWQYTSPVANMVTSSSYGPFVFWGLHGPSPQSRSHSGNLCPNGYFWLFPSKPGEMAQMAVFGHLSSNAHLRTLTQNVQKTLSRPLGQFLAQNPKVAKSPKGPRNTFASSEAITSTFSLLPFHLKTFGCNLLSNEPICHK
ncbi:hypothetical protein O181_095578 [Austropuccinia psidii MF-1]|uniref:Uncharacterized protein n=1 Tax=Austropuccinia psidii MF-1 TaxID=1389203 RepID=A0A9Q3J429_9BASI|nr:hypothetical protein [Austropuccinia psidii MF-1]